MSRVKTPDGKVTSSAVTESSCSRVSGGEETTGDGDVESSLSCFSGESAESVPEI